MRKIQKANVQYNDLIGTSAADFDNSVDELIEYASEKGIDTRLFRPIGLKVYFGELENIYLTFFVVDINNIAHECNVNETRNEFLNRFKRFEIVLGSKYENLNEFTLGEPIVLD